MLVWVVAMGMVVFWLVAFPPDSLTNRARAVLVATACLVGALCAWGMVRSMDEMTQARSRALQNLRRSEREKSDAIRRIREGDDPGSSQPVILN